MMQPYYQDSLVTLYHGDARDIVPQLPPRSVQCVVTSPPYFGLRRYSDDEREIGGEPTPAEYVAHLVDVFSAAWDVLADDGTLWLNLGDSYANDTKWGGRTSGKHATGLQGSDYIGRNRHMTGLPSKSLIGIPWRVAFALQDAGWVLRNEIIWHKPSVMPESVTDRLTRDHETMFLFTKKPHYYFNQAAIAEPVRRADRPQYMRAVEIALEAGLTNKHIDAIRAAGITDTGKAQKTQSGTGKNSDEVLRLAAEAKKVLGGYYREFLTVSVADSFKRSGNKRSAPVVPGNNATHRDDRDDVHYNKLTRNRRTVWRIAAQPLRDEHFAPFPEALVEPCILAGSRPGDTVLDMFAGSGTTMRVAERFGRHSIGVDLNQTYLKIQERRTNGVQMHMEALL